jgi:hypothetical protein
MPWDGAYNQVPSDATGFPHRNERFPVQHLVETDPEPGTISSGFLSHCRRPVDAQLR